MATTTTTHLPTPNERKPNNTTKITHIGAPPPEPEHLPCPRCDSTNTKFCYYNNYNFSQPRHFCKSCRRYWTHGGTLRDIPIGGGTRKNAKRSRNNHIHNQSMMGNVTTVVSANSSVVVANNGGGSGNHHGVFGGHNVGEFRQGGSFTALLGNGGHNGFLGLGGFGPGIEDLGFGLGRSVCPIHGMVESNGGGGTWQMENGHHGFVGIANNNNNNINGECFTLPELAISTPGTTMLK